VFHGACPRRTCAARVVPDIARLTLIKEFEARIAAVTSTAAVNRSRLTQRRGAVKAMMAKCYALDAAGFDAPARGRCCHAQLALKSIHE
jgi:hypothetical protein